MKIHSFAQLSKPSHWCSLRCVVCWVQDTAGGVLHGPLLKSQNTSRNQNRSKSLKHGYSQVAVAIGLPHWKGPSYIMMSLFVASDSLSLSSIYAFLIIQAFIRNRSSFTYSCIVNPGCGQECGSMVKLVLSVFKALGPI